MLGVQYLIPSAWFVTSPAFLGKPHLCNESRPSYLVFFPANMSPSQLSSVCFPASLEPLGGHGLSKLQPFSCTWKKKKKHKACSCKQTRETWELKTNRLASGSSVGIFKKKKGEKNGFSLLIQQAQLTLFWKSLTALAVTGVSTKWNHYSLLVEFFLLKFLALYSLVVKQYLQITSLKVAFSMTFFFFPK